MNLSRTTLAFAAVAALLAVFVVSGAQREPIKVGEQAPTFTATASDGKEHTLASLTKDAPMFVYFIKESCPINEQAAVFYKRLHEAYKGKATFVGVIDGGKEAAAAWSKRHGTTFPILFDPDKKIIKAYKAARSPWFIEVGKDQKIVKVWPGFSGKDMMDKSASMAGAAKTEVAKIDTSGAPESTRFG